MKRRLYAGLLILAGVASFYTLFYFLGGFGAIISAFIITCIIHETAERTTNPND